MTSIVTKNDKIISITNIIPFPKRMFNKLIKLIQINIYKKLTGKIAQGYANTYITRKTIYYFN